MKKLALLLVLALLLPVYLLAQEEPEQKPQETLEQKLLGQVDSFKKAVSRIRGKEFRGDFKVGIKTKEELRKLILEKSKEDEMLGEFEKTRKLLVKLGAVKPEFDLRKTLTEMLTEQIAGFYDPEAKALYLMEETAAGPTTGMVLAHEMFHALQDQYFHIRAMQQVIHNNDDRYLAIMGIIEGEATLGGFEYDFEKKGVSIITLPMLDNFGAIARAGFEMDLRMKPDSAMARAPKIIREMLIFQYCEGSSFVQKFLQKHNSWKALDKLFERPPLSTEQIMHPDKYLAEKDYPVRIFLPELHKKLNGQWEEVTTSTMGEFLLKVLLSEFVDGKTAAAAAAGWDGDSYTFIASKEKGGPQIIAWLSVWDSKDDAEEFVKAYAQALGKRYKKEPELTNTGYFLNIKQGEETALIHFAGTQVLIIQGAPRSLLPKITAEMLKARQVVMKEADFGDLSRKKLELPKTPEKPKPPPEKEPKKEPAKRDF